MMERLSRRVALILIKVLVLIAVGWDVLGAPASAGSLGPLFDGFARSAIYSSLDANDYQEAQRSVRLALTARIGETFYWENSRNGNTGTVTPLRDGRKSSGEICRELQLTAVVGNRTESATSIACQQPNGPWSIVQSQQDVSNRQQHRQESRQEASQNDHRVRGDRILKRLQANSKNVKLNGSNASIVLDLVNNALALYLFDDASVLSIYVRHDYAKSACSNGISYNGIHGFLADITIKMGGNMLALGLGGCFDNVDVDRKGDISFQIWPEGSDINYITNRVNDVNKARRLFYDHTPYELTMRGGATRFGEWTINFENIHTDRQKQNYSQLEFKGRGSDPRNIPCDSHGMISQCDMQTSGGAVAQALVGGAAQHVVGGVAEGARLEREREARRQSCLIKRYVVSIKCAGSLGSGLPPFLYHLSITGCDLLDADAEARKWMVSNHFSCSETSGNRGYGTDGAIESIKLQQ